MSNRNIVMAEDGQVIGEYHASLACLALVHGLIDKYNPEQSGEFFCDPDKVLAPVYEQCQGFEKVQLLLFINDESVFDQSDIPKLDEAIERYSFTNEGPKKLLVFMREMLDKHQKVTKKYVDTTFGIAVTTA